MSGSRVVAPKADMDRIPCVDQGLSEGDTWQFGDLEMICIETPGHTKHGLAFWFPSANVAFTGANYSRWAHPGLAPWYLKIYELKDMGSLWSLRGLQSLKLQYSQGGDAISKWVIHQEH